jgi:hypothetical protein
MDCLFGSKKQDPTICCLQETHLTTKDINKVKGQRKISQARGNRKQAGGGIRLSDKADFMHKSVRRDKEDHHILIKGTIQQEVMTILTTYAQNISAPKFIKQTPVSLKQQTGPDTITVRDLSSMDRTSRPKEKEKKKINKHILELNNTIDESGT